MLYLDNKIDKLRSVNEGNTRDTGFRVEEGGLCFSLLAFKSAVSQVLSRLNRHSDKLDWDLNVGRLKCKRLNVF